MPSLGYFAASHPTAVGGTDAAYEEEWGVAPPPFLCKTYQMVQDPRINDVISWNTADTGFIVWQPMEFARDVLPRHFKHNNFSSFVRQLSTYGFRKIAMDRWEFSNDYFRRGEKSLLCHIQRRRANPFAVNNDELPTTPVSPRKVGQDEVIMDDNERLRRENKHLTRELTHMKKMCGNIQLMVSSFPGNPPLENMIPHLDGDESPSGGGGGLESTNTMDHVDVYTMLFGVPIGLKRPRCYDGDRVRSDIGFRCHRQPA